jgi:carbonic anhydrase
MAKKAIARMLVGFRQFREKFFEGDDPTYSRLSQTPQAPKTLVIGCSDSRVDPALLTGAGPGEMFVVRNVANLVPPFETGGGRHGVSAAIEFAVVNLQVENVIVLGHRQCGGIRALMFPEESKAGGFVQQWVTVAAEAKERALDQTGSGDPNILWRSCELESIKTSIENLRTFPFVLEAEQNRGLSIIGIYFDLERGELLEFNEQSGSFVPIHI